MATIIPVDSLELYVVVDDQGHLTDDPPQSWVRASDRASALSARTRRLHTVKPEHEVVIDLTEPHLHIV